MGIEHATLGAFLIGNIRFGGGYDLPGIHSICIDPRDPNRVTIAISSGGVWPIQGVHGESWQCRADGMRAEYMPPDQAFNPDIQDPHRMVQCSSSPDCFWVQHHNGIFKSTNCHRGKRSKMFSHQVLDSPWLFIQRIQPRPGLFLPCEIRIAILSTESLW